MSVMDVYLDNVLIERWDDDTRTYTDFRTEPDSVRPYTPAENAEADSRTAANEAAMNQRSIDDALALRMAALQAILDDTNANINSNPAQRIKDIARAVRLLIRVARGDFTGTT